MTSGILVFSQDKPGMNLLFVLLGALTGPALAALEIVPGATWTAVSFVMRRLTDMLFISDTKVIL